MSEFAATLRRYRISVVYGDKYGGDWPAAEFRKHGINYEPAEMARSDLYRELLPAINSGAVALLQNERLIAQFSTGERRTGHSGRDQIDHAPGGHDDVANAAAGALVLASRRSGRLVDDDEDMSRSTAPEENPLAGW